MKSDNKYIQQLRSIFSIGLFVILLLGVTFLTLNFIIRLADKLS